jgi:hypothetical protein
MKPEPKSQTLSGYEARITRVRLTEPKRPLSAHELKAQTDLISIVRTFTNLRRAGQQFIGLCPIHRERHPSLYVHPAKQVFHCFGCGAGGDVFAFIMEVVGCGFGTSLEIVAEFSAGLARASEPRSGSRSGTSEGASPQAAERPPSYSQFKQQTRTQVLAQVETTNRQLAAIETTNRAASLALATPCEPDRGFSFIYQKPDNSHG